MQLVRMNSLLHEQTEPNVPFNLSRDVLCFLCHLKCYDSFEVRPVLKHHADLHMGVIMKSSEVVSLHGLTLLLLYSLAYDAGTNTGLLF